ncbi:MAG: PVC-type heme-binding CxxCH protein, partial [Verrucomicrobiota bacterium]
MKKWLLMIVAGFMIQPVRAIEPDVEDTILLYGNAFAEHLQQDGTFEALVHQRFPTHRLQVRSLAWTGDTVGFRLRPNGYVNHLRNLLEAWPANLVLACFGMNESLGGTEGLARFKNDLRIYIEELKIRHPEARFVLVSPIAVEDLQNPLLPDTAQRNRQVEQYVTAMNEEADKAEIAFIDLFRPTISLYEKTPEPLTENGIHLNKPGIRKVAEQLQGALFPGRQPSRLKERQFARLHHAVKDKVFHVTQRVRPLNGVHYYGVRARSYEYNSEMPRLDDLIKNRDERIWAYAEGKVFETPIDDSRITPLHEVARGGARSAYADRINSPEETRRKFHIHDRIEVDLFASEIDFPDLINPIQMKFDMQGRLWVATIPTYPIWVPGEKPDDRILILEDTDGDGKADKQTVFAEGLNLPDGLVLTPEGAIVSLQPRLVHLKDTDGDDRADEEIELFRGFDCTDTHHGGMLSRGPDGLIYVNDGVFHRSQVETPWGVCRNRDSS